MLYDHRRVVVTGMGVISPIGLTVSSMWEALISGKSGVDYMVISRFDYALKIADEMISIQSEPS